MPTRDLECKATVDDGAPIGIKNWMPEKAIQFVTADFVGTVQILGTLDNANWGQIGDDIVFVGGAVSGHSNPIVAFTTPLEAVKLNTTVATSGSITAKITGYDAGYTG